jgi:hypothetical protein
MAHTIFFRSGVTPRAVAPRFEGIPPDPDSGQKSRIRVRVEMAISNRSTIHIQIVASREFQYDPVMVLPGTSITISTIRTVLGIRSEILDFLYRSTFLEELSGPPVRFGAQLMILYCVHCRYSAQIGTVYRQRPCA